MELDRFLNNLEKEGKICLEGSYWHEAFTIITSSNKRDNSILPNPLILGGWSNSSDKEKKERFIIHLEYANKNDKWPELLEYFENLDDNAWYKN